MNNNVLVTLKRGAVSSTLASAFLLQQASSVQSPHPLPGGVEAAFTGTAKAPEIGTQQEAGSAFTFTFKQAPSAWDKKLEREFRRLALEEARGTLTQDGQTRLEQLSHWRNQLLCPQSAEAILLQIRRDRLLEKTEELLKEYVEFQEATSKTRTST